MLHYDTLKKNLALTCMTGVENAKINEIFDKQLNSGKSKIIEIHSF